MFIWVLVPLSKNEGAKTANVWKISEVIFIRNSERVLVLIFHCKKQPCPTVLLEVSHFLSNYKRLERVFSESS